MGSEIQLWRDKKDDTWNGPLPPQILERKSMIITLHISANQRSNFFKHLWRPHFYLTSASKNIVIVYF